MFAAPLFLFLSCQSPGEPLLFDGFGNFERPISTSSSAAQDYFDQGMQLLYGFNHDEAIRSFHAAAESDPDAPMPWWGIAYANGININDPAMTEQRSTDARQAADHAMARLANASAVEQALIHAVDARYATPIPEDRMPLDQAYAKKMEEAYQQFPQDTDVATLFAESLMNLQPWDYWTNEGAPKGRIQDILSALEGVLERDGSHPGANHFFIHATEASQNPDQAIPAADRLTDLVPGSGHLVHMPSHIYVRVGRYSDAVDSNAAAVAADRAYFAKAPEPSAYAIYYGHNLHFLAYAAMMSGRYEDAITAARSLEEEVPKDALRAYASSVEGIMPTTLHVLIRFGKWEQVLLEPEYEDYRLVSRAIRRYARSIALSALGRTEEARAEMELFFEYAALIPDEWYIFNNQMSTVMPIAEAMIRGELLYREGRTEEAFAILREGVAAEDALVYDEPPAWMLPVRHALGALLMGDGQFKAAEAVYREDLKHNRNNGWALLGLQKSLEAQGRSEEAMKIDPMVVKAWQKADVQPTSSCYCEPGS